MRVYGPVPGAVIASLACLAMHGAAAEPAAGAAGFDAIADEIPAYLTVKDWPQVERRLVQLAKLDGPRTIREIDTIDNEQRRSWAVEVAFCAWARQAPRTAVAWAKTNRSELLGWNGFVDLCVELRDITLVEEAILTLPEGVGKNFALRRTTQVWGRFDLPFIEKWTQGLKARGVADQPRDYAVAGFVDAFARVRPAEAIRWVQECTPIDHNSRRRYYQGVAQAMNDTGKFEAMEKFFRANPNNPDYNLALGLMVRELSAKAPERLEALFAEVELPLSLSSMLGVATTSSSVPPGLRARLRVKYEPNLNAVLTIRALQKNLVEWAAEDKDAAFRFIDGIANLTTENRQRLREAVVAAR
jgi:hypothetical protein